MLWVAQGKVTLIKANVAIAAANGFVTAENKNYLSDNGGHIKHVGQSMVILTV